MKIYSLIAICLICGMSFMHAKPVRFMACGDMPYQPEELAQFKCLLKAASGEDFEFIVHVGDVKWGKAECSDPNLKQVANIFEAQKHPIVYTPGDNDWTDCHNVGDYDPLERLEKIREWYFQDESALRLDSLGIERQSDQPQFSNYIEHYRFWRQDILFVALHVVGSNNNRKEDSPSSMREFSERTFAVNAFLRSSFKIAKEKDAAAICLIMHANPRWQKNLHDPQSGYYAFLRALYAELETFRRPVVAIHGDSHVYRFDQPLYWIDTNTPIERFTRIEVYGAPDIKGLDITLDPEQADFVDVKLFAHEE